MESSPECTRMRPLGQRWGLERRLREVPVRYMVNDRPWPWLGPFDDPPPSRVLSPLIGVSTLVVWLRTAMLVLLLAERTIPECTWSSCTCTLALALIRLPMANALYRSSRSTIAIALAPPPERPFRSQKRRSATQDTDHTTPALH